MKYIIAILAVLAVLGGGYYYMQQKDAGPAMIAVGEPNPSQPNGAAGINGSQNQGNLGQPDNGNVQQPGADGAEGAVIGGNFALGADAGHLIAYNGMTLYTYSKDSENKSVCVDECAKIWPPYVVGPEDNVAQLQAGITGKTGTITRADGSIQMTYNGKPLYFYAQDSKSGDMNGDKIGNVWFVAKP